MDGCASSSSPSSSTPGGGAPADSLIGLKFGQKIYFEGVNSGFQSKTGGGSPPASTPPPCSPAKKGKGGIGQGGRPPVCLVEGCNVDLSDAKPYYSKHKVCGIHSKFPKVIVGGLEQRFCQQCSRFHQLSEFDREKRSCRRRLAGHNERRRKPLLSPRCGSLSSSLFADNNLNNGLALAVGFNSYSALSGRDSWLSTISERGSRNEAIQAGNQSPWQSNKQNPIPDLLQGSTRPPYFNGVSDSAGALSLLSSQPWGSRSRSPSGLAQNGFLSTNGTVMAQPTTGQLSLPSWGFKSNQANSALQDLHPDPSSGLGELGLAQPADGRFHELEHSRGYNSSVQHMGWPL